ncbi:MAG TPA: hypothetical protein VFS77_14235 [Pyrinomonadaceae bacterium]|nr:hypothetical protein [Pyrinomonadaceae bacterium]
MTKVVTYLMLVGLPLLGVLGVLHYGNNALTLMCIQGPRTAHASKPSTNSSCKDQLLQAEQHGFSISQSGPEFSVSFKGEPKVVLYGQVQETSVNAAAPRSVSKDDNGSNLIGLRATIDRQTNPAHLWGVFSFDNCPDMKFVAIQQSETSWTAR